MQLKRSVQLAAGLFFFLLLFLLADAAEERGDLELDGSGLELRQVAPLADSWGHHHTAAIGPGFASCARWERRRCS